MLCSTRWLQNVQSLIATALKKKSWIVEEDVFCLATNGSSRRIDIIAYSQTTKKGYIIDPTIRIETGSSQPEDVNQEKINIYLPTVDYFKVKYQLENIEVIGLLIGARAIGLEVNPEKTKYMIMSRDQNIVRNGTIKIGDLSFEEVEKFKYLGATVTNINDTREEIKRRLNMGNACYYSVEKLLSSSLLSKSRRTNKIPSISGMLVMSGSQKHQKSWESQH
ncbi:hypothetical protein ANN_25227 [Periplaneta americana]|uniref:Uncharacterized protein n=1 Tax=Periplaneta americana TaxID=6978 RepID=A0ABQ8S0Z9_PERAM|nr:hypothetical protein ANN_25227 [Periplaneta americana]